MSTPVLSQQEIITYAETRLFGSNFRPGDVNSITLHNGVLPSQLERILSSVGDRFVRVEQPNGREPLYVQDGRLHIPQYSGFSRRERYERMIKAYVNASNSNIAFRSLEAEGKPRKTNHAYDNLAYDFVKKLFETERMQDITTIIFGPLNAALQHAKMIAQRPDEYLPSQILKIGSTPVLNMGYVFSDQAGILIDKMLIEYAAIARQLGRQMHLDMFMFGRVGGLHPDMRRHSLVVPTGIVDDTDLNHGRVFTYPMHNVLAGRDGFQGLNLNVSAVIDETVEQLRAAAEAGCVCVEMETREAVEAINTGRRRHLSTLDIDFGFLGYVSDLPLSTRPEDKIAVELDSDRGEQAAVRRIMDYMLSH